MLKNKFILFIIIVLVFIGGYYFYNSKKANTTANPNQQIVGNDKDSHGCIGSAGYVYSALRAGCIRIFEAGVRMEPKDASLDQVTAAYVVFKSPTEYQTVELFLPGSNVPLTLTFNKGMWSDSDHKYTLAKMGEGLILLNENRVLLYEYSKQ